MNKLLYILIGVLVISGCTKKFSDLNTDPKNPTVVPSEALFTSAQKEMGDQVASTNVNTNNFKLWSQFWQETTYLDESQYDVKNRAVPDNAWETWYRDVIKDLVEAKVVLAGEPAFPPGAEADAIKVNKNAIMDLLIVYSYQRLVDMFGDIPYSTSMDIDNNLLPAYDDAWTIYQDLVVRIDAAIADLDPAYGSFGSADLMNGGDVDNWIAFAYSMKLKMGVTVSDKYPGEADTWIMDAYDKVISSSAQNCELAYLGSTPNTNPLYVDLVLSGRKDFVAGQTIIDTMLNYNDPRISKYFNEVCLADQNEEDSCVYRGGAIGESSSWSSYSKPADRLYEASNPVVLMSYNEMLFYLAEAAAKGFGVGSAQTFYEDAITASFDYWEADSIADYLATPGVAWGTNGYTPLEQIARESWLGFYNRGFIAYTQVRRLNFPLPIATDAIDGVYPLRYTYPIGEQTLNGANYTTAASAIGGDYSDTRIFWDVD